MMNHQKFLLPIAIGCACANFLFSSCDGYRQNASGQTDSLHIDTLVRLEEGAATPACSFQLNYAYLRPSSEQDTLAARIHRQVVTTAFGKQYAGLAPQQFVRTLAEDYLNHYRKDVENLYREDKARGLSPDELPAWYNYEYDFQTRLQPGAPHVWNYTVLSFSYTGGAHPNTYRQCLNIDARDGHLYTKEEVFDLNHESDICQLLLRELIAEANRRLETDTITSVQGLQENGMLLNDGGLFVPDNFLLKKDHVVFVYNRYDIAPYSAGDFVLTVSNDELQPYYNTSK